MELVDKWLSSKLLDRIKIPKGERKSTVDNSTISTLAHFIEVHDISESQKRQYKVLYRALQRFTLYTGTSIELDDLTADTLRQFADYLSLSIVVIKKSMTKYPSVVIRNRVGRMISLEPCLVSGLSSNGPRRIT